MDYRQLGRTGLRVSALGFGCGDVGGLIVRGTLAERERAVARAVELGINYFDTAAAYGNGRSQENLGEVLQRLKPDVYVGTKFRLEPADLSDVAGAWRARCEAEPAPPELERVDSAAPAPASPPAPASGRSRGRPSSTTGRPRCGASRSRGDLLLRHETALG